MVPQSARLSSVLAFAALAALSLPSLRAQQDVPPAPAPAARRSGRRAHLPGLQPDPANFTAASPTKEIVNAFLQTSWGFDDSRIWQVQAILKTPVEGISKVVVLVGDKTGKQKPSALQFFALPDGKHIIAGDEIIPFGEHPLRRSSRRAAAARRRPLSRLRLQGSGTGRVR